MGTCRTPVALGTPNGSKGIPEDLRRRVGAYLDNNDASSAAR